MVHASPEHTQEHIILSEYLQKNLFPIPNLAFYGLFLSISEENGNVEKKKKKSFYYSFLMHLFFFSLKNCNTLEEAVVAVQKTVKGSV